MPNDHISFEELASALVQAERDAERRGFTTKELADVLGVAPVTARDRVKVWIKSGQARSIGRQPRIAMSGEPCRLPCYELVQQSSTA